MTDPRPDSAAQRSVLIVEDDPIVIRTLSLQLQDKGWAVEVTDSADEAQTLSRSRPDAVVLIDTGVHQLDGVKLARSLKAENPDRIVIAMTGYPNLNQLLEGLYDETFDYLVKPFRIEQLDMVIDRARREIALRAENVLLKTRLAHLEDQLALARKPPAESTQPPTETTEPLRRRVINEPDADAIASYERQMRVIAAPTTGRPDEAEVEPAEESVEDKN